MHSMSSTIYHRIKLNLLLFRFQNTAEDSGAEELTVANVGGVFVVLMSGGGVAILVSIFEMLYDVKNRAKELEVRIYYQFLKMF